MIGLLTGLSLLLLWVLRPLSYKYAAKNFPPEMSSWFTCLWLVLGLLITLPFLGHLLVFDNHNALSSPYILLSVYKGVSLFYFISLQQSINKTSTSSSVFLGFIALALAAVVNNFLFAENLGAVKVICIIGLGVLGYFFLKKGDAKRLSSKEKVWFAIVTLILASYTVCDHLAIPKVGWYAHLLVSSVALLAVCLVHKVSKANIKIMFTNKHIIVAGIIYTVSEFFVIYSTTNILPASIVAVYLRLAIPIVMIISAIRYKEQTVRSQVIFSVSAIILALPIILT